MLHTTEELIQKGKDAIRKNDPIQAKDLFRKAVETNPKSADAKVELARMESVLGNLVEAERLLDEALAIRADHPFALALRGAIKILSRQFEQAVPLLERAIQIDPGISFAHLNLGIAQRELGLLDPSENSIRKAIDVNKNNFEAYYALAHTLCLKGKVDEGIQATLKSIEINPLFVKGYKALGTMYSMARKPELAERLYDECLKRVPDAIVIRQHLVDLYLQFGKTEAARAEMEVIAQQRGSLTDWLRLGNLSVLTKNYKAAAVAFQRASKVAAQAWEPHYNLGDLYDASNFNELAGKEYELAVKFNTGSHKPHNGLGLWFLKQNRTSEAIEQLTKAHEINRTAPEPAYNLALALIQAKQKDQARSLLKTIQSSSQPGPVRENAERLLNALRS